MNRLVLHLAVILAAVVPLRSARAGEPQAEFVRGINLNGAKASRDPAAARAFDEQVAPILARHCLECHGATIRKGGLSLATKDAAYKGGKSGPAIEPGEPASSPLWEHVDSGAMPKGRPHLILQR